MQRRNRIVTDKIRKFIISVFVFHLLNMKGEKQTQMKNKTADFIYGQMLSTALKDVSKASLQIMNAIQKERVCNQMLGLAAALICMLHQYNLTHQDVLGIAHNIVYSGANNNIQPDFKAIQQFMKNEWEI